LRRRSICSGVAGFAGHGERPDRTHGVDQQEGDDQQPRRKRGQTKRAASKDEAQHVSFRAYPAHLRALTDGAELAALDPLVEALELHGVVDPDIRAVAMIFAIASR